VSVAVSRAKLMGAVKELNLRWARVRELWDDAAAANVQSTVIDPLEPRVRAAVTALEKMNALLIKVRSDCQ